MAFWDRKPHKHNFKIWRIVKYFTDKGECKGFKYIFRCKCSVLKVVAVDEDTPTSTLINDYELNLPKTGEP